MFQILRNLLPDGSGTRTPQEAPVGITAEGNHSRSNQNRSGSPDSLEAALASWTLDLDVHVFLDRIITNDLLYDLIFAGCSPTSLVRLLRTCRATNSAVKDYISRAFNINHLLFRYFSDPMAFRYLQACTGTVISGSTALQFFDRSFYPESDLDIYVPMAWRLKVGHYLSEQGYRFVPNSIQHPNYDVAVSERRVITATARYGNLRGIAGVFTFKKRGADGEERKVQIMVAVRSPIEVIFRFHSTCVMNVITFNRAYCLYPRATLEDRLSLVCTGRGDMEEIYDKYRERGWYIIPFYDQAQIWTSDPTFTDMARWIDDGHSWSIPLPYSFPQPIAPVNPHSASLTRDPVSVTSWALMPDRRNRGYMHFYHVKSPQLFYPYVMESVEAVNTPSVAALMHVTAQANVRPSSHIPLDDRRYVDERFMQLCHDYYHIMF